MPLRSPRYLNRTDFYDHADYHDIDIPRRVEILARTSTNRSGGAKLGLQSIGLPIGLEGQLGDSVELQSAYVLEVGEKSSFSRVLDAMEDEGQAALTRLPLPGGEDQRWVTSRDQLVELTGTMKLSPVSSIGKIMNVMFQLVGHKDIDLNEIFSRPSSEATGRPSPDEADGENLAADEPTAPTDPENIPAQAQEIFKAVYLRNEIPEIPTLFKLELDEEDAPWSVFINCEPGHFVGDGAAATDSIEGEVTVVGVVREFVGEDPSDGFISTEPWTLHGWERTMRAMLRTRMDDLVQSLIPQFDPGWQAGDESYYIKGPAVVIDAVAIF
ncbi:hypothetical protein [Brachybacterium sp. ACRRE]|uniref:DUF6414 family protein n=1 Tax=Brachybacterium sp. ACRRE TaxID=2918184 RepID=UPI001EF2971F|nr:hypothetical protein [Brachybacterium sp. ACRRE]MCG7310977.1 hypothetical protein [Brachybacterium sp. ACRRE]